MTSSGWSRLLLGTILATSVFGPASAQTAYAPETTLAATAREAATHSTSDMKIDPAALVGRVEAALAAARAADTIAEEELDRLLTGSIAAIQPGPRTGGLTELAAPNTNALSDPKVAPEPVRPQPASLTTTPPAEAPLRAEAKPEPAPAASAPQPSAPTIEAKPAESATLPSETPKAPESPAAAAAEVPATPPVVTGDAAPAADAAAPETAPGPTVGAEKAVEATPAAEPSKPAEAAAVAPTGETPAAVAETPPAASAAVAAPAPSEAVAAPAVATAAQPTAPAVVTPEVTAVVAPALGQTPSMSASYSTASEPVPTKPEAAAAAPIATTTPTTSAPAMAALPATPVREPMATATTLPATASATALPATATATAVPASPAAPAVAPRPSTDAAIAATLAAEQAATALKTALEEIQPLAGPAEERADRAAILAFYADRAFLPLFVDAQGTTDRARGALAALARAGEDGLEARDYGLPRVEAGLSPEVRAKAEIAFAQTTVRFARHLQSGRFDPGRVHELVTPTPTKTEAREVLERLAASPASAATLQAYAPTHAGYLRLKAMLAELRGAAPEAPMVMVPVGPTLKPGQKDARVALLRERLGVNGMASDAETYDPSLAEVVKAFQRDRGLNPSGAVGRDTISALNGEKSGTASRIADLISNMERWRWLPRDLGALHVFVNVPDFHLDVMKDGRSIHHARVIVGKPSNPTPVFSDVMEQVVVNPYWNVPYSIVKKEMMGRLQSSAGQSLGGSFEVHVGRQRVDPTTVDWTTVNAANVSIRQRPGAGNALGNIKFLFPNQHSVYLHDTSSRGLFTQSFRALSHGCVRVHEPFSFADAVLAEEPEKVDGARLKKMIGGGEKTINLQYRVPVHINYFTAWVDDGGQLQTRPDVYGHDAKVKRLLGL